jgi:carboxylesterase type B
VVALCLKIVIFSVQAQDNSTDEVDNLASVEDIEDYDYSTNSTEEADSDVVEVNTFLGVIKGKISEDEDGEVVHKFLGIPYAQAPVGNLRFLPPKPVKRYDNLEAFKYGSTCPQKDIFINKDDTFSGDEDCLFLNIFLKPSNSTKLRPVMFWIHGGGFVLGSADIYNPAPLIKEDVIVVTINYRLGALGFLNFGNDIAPGNLGLRDQIQALEWVNHMIDYFGGDPNAVTIFGESAGGMSSHALTMSPKAHGLMSAAIFESGTMLMSREDYKRSHSHRIADHLSRYFNCTSMYRDHIMLECLQNLPVEDILTSTKLGNVLSRIDSEIQLNSWLPVIDTYSRDPVLPIDYLTAMKNGYFNKIPIMTGTVLNDGALVYPELEYGEFWKRSGPMFMLLTSSFNNTEITEEEYLQSDLAKQYYSGTNNNLLETLPEYANMMTDSLFLSPDQKVAELASKYVSVYNYRFVFSGSSSYLPFFLTDRAEDFGAPESAAKFNALKPVHGDETIYLFDIFRLRTDEERQMRENMVKYWTNFAKFMHPSPLLRDNITQWFAYSNDKRYMVLDVEPEMDADVEKQRMAFWQKIHWNGR